MGILTETDERDPGTACALSLGRLSERGTFESPFTFVGVVVAGVPSVG